MKRLIAIALLSLTMVVSPLSAVAMVAKASSSDSAMQHAHAGKSHCHGDAQMEMLKADQGDSSHACCKAQQDCSSDVDCVSHCSHAAVAITEEMPSLALSAYVGTFSSRLFSLPSSSSPSYRPPLTV